MNEKAVFGYQDNSYQAAGEEAGLLCMKHAAEKQNYTSEFKEYLLVQLRVPAERIQQVCQR